MAYIVRPNAQTLDELSKRLRAKLRGADLQADCISLYIRHGDKAHESKVFEDPEYESALYKLLQNDTSLTHQVFLSTDDPATVEYFADLGHTWPKSGTTYIGMPRK